MLKMLKDKVYMANLDLVKHNLVLFTWGNVSEIDSETGYVVIKPSGVNYENMKSEDMVVVDLDGNIIEGNLKPSSDLKTHLEIYKNYKNVKGITHTHSTYATSFAQAGKDITAYGTTHADYFYGDIPCIRSLSKAEVETDYEKNTGKIIVDELKRRNIDPISIPAVLVKNHGVFTFGNDCDNSVYNAVVVEEVAKMATITKQINNEAEKIDDIILDKHYLRKHGKNAYYGQREK